MSAALMHGPITSLPFQRANRCPRTPHARTRTTSTTHAVHALPPAINSHNDQGTSCSAAPPLASRRSLLGTALLLTLPALQSRPAAAKPLTVIDVDKAAPGERDVYVTSSGIKYAEVSKGSGNISKSGDLVLVDVVGRLEGGQVFLDTRKLNAPLAFQIGTSNKCWWMDVPEGISQLVEGMSSGSVRLAVLPPSLGYGGKSVDLPGATVPPNSKLFYEVELLRCEKFTLGLACCTEQVFTGNKGGDRPEGSCIKKPQPEATVAAPS